MFGTFVADDPAITLDGERGPQVPFENVFLHGLIRDEFGRKMSKSRGNGIDPLDWVEMFGADALRFTLARGASPGGDLSIGEDHARASRNFATKLFNATRFALMNGASPGAAARRCRPHRCRPVDPRPDGRGPRRGGFDVRQLRVQPGLRGALPLRLGRVLRLVRRAGQSAAAEGVQHTTGVFAAVLDTLLKLLHPVMPFVTEVLWKALTGGESLVIADWPKPSGFARRSRCGTTCRRYAEAHHRGPPVPQRPGPQRPAAGAGAAVRYRGGRPRRAGSRAVSSLAWLTARRGRLQPVGAVEVRMSQRDRGRRTRHLGHRRRRRRTAPAREGPGRRARRNWQAPQGSSGTTPSWRRRRPTSSRRSATASRWPAKKSIGSRRVWRG